MHHKPKSTCRPKADILIRPSADERPNEATGEMDSVAPGTWWELQSSVRVAEPGRTRPENPDVFRSDHRRDRDGCLQHD